MPLPPFELERYFAEYEFSTPYVLCASDVEPYRLDEILALADRESQRLWEDLSLGYTQSSGHPLLREAIADLYTDIGPDDIVVSTGAEEAIYLTVQALLGPGDHAVVVWPAYQSLRDVGRAAGAEVELLPLDPSTHWLLDPDRLARSLRPTTKLVILNYPHNPTGALPARAGFAALVDVVERSGAYLLSDEVYRYLEHDASQRLPAGVETGPRALSIGVLSKAFGLAGLRIGWVVSRDWSLLRRINALKDYTTICNSAPSEILGLMALRAREAVLDRSQTIIRQNLDLVTAFMKRWHRRLGWVKPRAGAVAFPWFRPPIQAEDAVTRAREEAGLLLLPGRLLGFPGPHFRIGFGRRNVPDALEHFDRHLARHYRDS